MKHLAAIGVWFVFGARLAGAQPAGAQAEILFREAKDLLAKGKIAEACAAFDASQKLDPTVATILNQANCREKNEELATAWGLFLVAERQSRAATDDATKQLHQIAVDHAAKLEPRLSTLTISVPDDTKIGGLEILRDKEDLAAALWSKALPVDGGTYQITARAPGNAEWSTTITVANERDVKAIEIPKLKAAVLAHATGSPIVAATPPPVAEPHDAPSEPRRSSRLPLYVAGGAVAALGAGLAFELVGESTFTKAKADLDPDRQISLWHTANAERYTAEVLAIAGVATAGVAVWLYLRDRSAERGVVIAPAVSGDRVGVQLVGGF